MEMGKMRIYILCNDGSPIGITYKDIYGESGRVGLGGAELALLTLAEGWTKAGHEVVLFNDPKKHGESPFEQRNICDYERDTKCDTLIVFRSPTQKIVHAKGCLKVWLSMDQYTIGDFKHFSTFMDKVVTISPRHSRYFKETYGIENAIDMDLPVRVWDYDLEVEKIPFRMIFTSVPDRGLGIVAEIYPQIKEEVPEVSLVITSDYRLWGVPNPMNNQYVQKFLSMKDVQFLGAVTRDRLVQEQLAAQIHLYPCIYDELFCISVAESQVEGAYPITSDCGALETTNMGELICGDANANKQAFVEKAVEYLNCKDLTVLQKELQSKARERFSLDRILKEWDEKVFK
jgi:glycosyltransferase involved in cell wall biosynthesis